MRPIYMEIQGLGPYGGREKIDFRPFEKTNFFLIWGATGSGKTTILDGICYALYGQSSGADREIVQMESQWSARGLLTEVVLDFSMGEKVYRIQRQPAQKVAKKRGEGLKSLSAKAFLWRRTGLKQGEEGEVLASGPRGVTRQVERLLGFQCDQFRQVILLPQGKFREVLEAPSKNREEILQLLFGTGIYKKVEERLKERAKEVGKKLERLSDQEKNFRDQAEVESSGELEQKLAELREQKRQLKKEESQWALREKDSWERLQEAKGLEEKFTEWEKAQKKFTRCKNREEKFKEKAQEVERAERAEILREQYRLVKERKKEFSKAQTERDGAIQKEKTCQKENKKREKALQQALKKGKEKDGLQKEMMALEALKKDVSALEPLEKEKEALEKKFQALEKGEKKIKDDLMALEKEGELQGKKLESAHHARGELGALTAELNRLKGFLDQGATLKKKGDLQKKSLCLWEGEKKKMEDLSRGIEDLSREISSMEEKWKGAQAGFLAQQLKEDAPCPVCGSSEHPLPARVQEKAPPWKEIVAKKKTLRQWEKNKSDLHGTMARREAELERLAGEIKGLEAELKEIGPWASFEKKIHLMEIDFQKKKKTAQQVEPLQKSLADLKNKKQILEKKREETAEKIHQIREKRGALNQAVSALEDRLPPEYTRAKFVQEAWQKASHQFQWIEKELARAEKAGQEAREKWIQARTTLEQKEKVLSETRGRMEKAQEDFLLQLKKQAFLGEEDFQKAQRTKQQLENLKGEISSFALELHSVKEQFEKLEGEIHGLKRPMIRDLSASYKKIKQTREKTLGKQKEKEAHLKQMEKIAKRWKTLQEQIQWEDKNYSLAQSVLEVVKGKNAHKLPLHRYVLSAFLNEVLAGASSRLILMSNHRYQLYRSREALLGRTGGLDLEVFDEWTGESRPVSTLSGGEGFLASLSLALALADVVQRYTGAIPLHSIFIDEGFGSLDSESLDMAITTLMDLQNGQRLVGIISHVPALRERIHSRLEVIAGKKGSFTRVVI